MNAHPLLCPFCGSIENHGNLCDWCHSEISNNYIDERKPKKMIVEIKFTDLTPESALTLMSQAAKLNALPVPVQDVVTAPVPTVTSVAAPAIPISQPTTSVASTVPVSVTPIVPVASAPTYSMADLGRAAGPLAMQGRQPELKIILNSFGVNALTELPPERYGEMAMRLREMGAQI